jgi:hypothetical protein
MKEAGKEIPPSDPNIMKEAGAEEKAAQAAEEKRLLETKEEELSAEDKVKRAEIIKRNDEAKAKAEADKQKSQAPEKYEFKMPEGMTLDQAAVDLITPVFKEMGLNQENAQKLVDKFIEIRKAAEERDAATFKKFNEDSYKETIQALGPNYKQELVYVAKIRDRFFSEETQELLDASGLANNKAFIADIIKLGKLISEDKMPDGKTSSPAGKSAAETLYPEQSKAT